VGNIVNGWTGPCGPGEPGSSNPAGPRPPARPVAEDSTAPPPFPDGVWGAGAVRGGAKVWPLPSPPPPLATLQSGGEVGRWGGVCVCGGGHCSILGLRRDCGGESHRAGKGAVLSHESSVPPNPRYTSGAGLRPRGRKRALPPPPPPARAADGHRPIERRSRGRGFTQ
jgi:hypothetical protein